MRRARAIGAVMLAASALGSTGYLVAHNGAQATETVRFGHNADGSGFAAATCVDDHWHTVLKLVATNPELHPKAHLAGGVVVAVPASLPYDVKVGVESLQVNVTFTWDDGFTETDVPFVVARPNTGCEPSTTTTGPSEQLPTTTTTAGPKPSVTPLKPVLPSEPPPPAPVVATSVVPPTTTVKRVPVTLPATL